MDEETKRQIWNALKTNNEITADIIRLTKQQEKFVNQLLNWAENLLEIMEKEDDSA